MTWNIVRLTFNNRLALEPEKDAIIAYDYEIVEKCGTDQQAAYDRMKELASEKRMRHVTYDWLEDEANEQ